ncbi:pirin-like C-terminal cupin domain-containing protein, partial [Methanoregula sp.]|uniref:pirin-like C-terminal cupin domain-containing protein n=1 Tax=Methanoregula sp. TaxID=2052170 RepID=UPI000CCA5081
EVRVVCWSIGGVTGPVRDLVADPEYLDVTLGPKMRFSHPVKPGYLAAAYVFFGSGAFDSSSGETPGNRTMIRYDYDGDKIDVRAGEEGVRFLFFAGKPLREPIAWGGPIVMNTQEELRQAFDEYENGTFIRKSS